MAVGKKKEKTVVFTEAAIGKLITKETFKGL